MKTFYSFLIILLLGQSVIFGQASQLPVSYSASNPGSYNFGPFYLHNTGTQNIYYKFLTTSAVLEIVQNPTYPGGVAYDKNGTSYNQSLMTLTPGNTVGIGPSSFLTPGGSTTMMTLGFVGQIGIWTNTTAGSTGTPDQGFSFSSSGGGIAGDFYAGNNATPVYTNYLLTVKNNLSTAATAVFTWNGATIGTQTLQPGQTATMLSPPVEVYPATGTATGSVTLTANGATVSQNPDGSLGFGTGAGTSTGGISVSGASGATITSGSGGTAGGGGSAASTTIGGTNAVTLTSGTNSDSIVVNTNNIVWQPAGTGDALDSTLRQVGNTLHADEQNNLSGLNIINTTLNTYSKMLTNELGQVITMQYQQTNWDGLIYGVLTKISTNSGTVSTGTNSISLSLTNYAQETTQQGISNLLAQIETNTAPGINTNNPYSFIPSYATNYDAANAIVQDKLSSVISAWNNNISSIGNPGINDGNYSAPDMTLAVMGFGVIDFNPMDNPRVASIFNTAKKFIAWLLVAAYLAKIIHDTIGFARWLGDGKVNTINPLIFEFLGTGGNAVGPILSYICIFIVFFVWAGVLAATCVWAITGFDIFGTISTDPFTGAPSGSMFLTTSFFPMGLFCALTISYLIWRSTHGVAVFVANAIIRLFPGG